MPLYPLKKISTLADGRQAYLRGVSGYNAGWVRDCTAEPAAFFTELVTARIEEPAGAYRIEVGFGDSGEAGHLSCTCGQFRPGYGACKHIVAALVHKYYRDMVEGATVAAPAAPQPVGESDPAVRLLIDQYTSKETVRLTATESGEPPVTLRPLLSLQNGRAVLAFTVGHERPYMIKNLTRFGEQMSRGEVAVYGKQLTLLHHRRRFTPESLPVLEFLLAELAERQNIPVSLGGSAAELRLSPAGVDRLFNLLGGGSITLQEGESQRTVLLRDGLPTLPVTVEHQREGIRLYGEPTQPLYGTSTLYLLHKGTLYRTGSDYTRRMTEWLRAVNRYPDGVFVAQAQLPAFCYGVLAAIRPYIRLEGDTQALEQHTPPALHSQIVLDSPVSGQITARVEFRYGPGQVAGYATPPQPWQDTLRELRVRLVLDTYFAPDPENPERLVLQGDEAEVFAFLTKGIPRLEQVAQVYPTAAMSRLSIASAPRFSVGLGLVDDLLDMHIDIEDIDPAELAWILTGYREHRDYARLRDGRFLPLDSRELAALAELTEGLGLSPKDLRNGHLSLPKYRALYLERLLQEHPVDVRRDSTFTGLTDRFARAVHSRYEVPATLQNVLRGYQRAGYRWLRTMEELGFGGILADDMGLGKTLQVITLMLAAKEAGNRTPSLVVCPTSVGLGWEREIARFAPSLSVLCVIGDAAERRRRLEMVSDYDVIITSYDMLKRDVSAYNGLSFHYQVLDEAQYIKNSQTQNARAVKTVQAACRFALTGTPVENRLGELWSIFDFLMPGLLFSYQKFRSRFEQPILRGKDDRALVRLRRLVTPFILRRLKSEVLAELPPKTERVLPATMERPQRQAYLATVQDLRSQLTHMNRLAGQGRISVLAMLTRLRQLCCDPRLCCEGYTGASCKLEACMELLQEAASGGHKVLLFSQFTSMLALIRERLEAEGMAYYLLQGSTPKEERARLVDAFNRDDTPVFLISLKAGGTGLNLTGADMVIHYDPWWNVAAQNQATDRAHRIGQKNPVQVVKLIARDTVEEKILQMQEKKAQLAQQVVEGNVPGIADLTVEELLELLE